MGASPAFNASSALYLAFVAVRFWNSLPTIRWLALGIVLALLNLARDIQHLRALKRP
jgi:hypothetical protein